MVALGLSPGSVEAMKLFTWIPLPMTAQSERETAMVSLLAMRCFAWSTRVAGSAERALMVEATTETTIAFQGNDALFQNAVVQSGVAVRVKTKLFSINTNDQNNGVVVSKSMVVDGGEISLSTATSSTQFKLKEGLQDSLKFISEGNGSSSTPLMSFDTRTTERSVNIQRGILNATTTSTLNVTGVAAANVAVVNTLAT